METRAWLLAQHGPVCAYCGQKGSARTMTLDHVTPRRGQIAYDRRDNLVLACKLCNAAKADKPLLAFLLADRTRAARLLRYGADHLSNGLITLAEELAGPLGGYSAAIRSDDESPYRD
jgi:5-methylcytosine-specific restriction endonuclease McrA